MDEPLFVFLDSWGELLLELISHVLARTGPIVVARLQRIF